MIVVRVVLGLHLRVIIAFELFESVLGFSEVEKIEHGNIN